MMRNKGICAMAVVLLLAVVMTSCGGAEGYNGEDYAVNGYNSEDYDYIPDESDSTRPLLQALTIECFIADIDHMMYVLETNFALLPVAYWARGIDYMTLADNARRAVMAMDESCKDTFLAILAYHFWPLFGIGHARLLDHQTFSLMHHNVWYGGYTGSKWMMNLALIRSAYAERFYDLGNAERERVFNDAFEHLILTYGMPTNHMMGGDIPDLPFQAQTMSIEEGRIAYISCGRSMEQLRQASSRISSFFGQITDYEHLILDLRGNMGGNVDHFINTLLRPVLREPIEAPYLLLFFADAPYVRRFGDILLQPSTYTGFITAYGSYRPISEILAEHDLPELNHDDIARLDYGVLAGRHRHSSIMPGALTGGANFYGKVWMLTDHLMGSAAQLAAFYAQYAGITLVGDITGGAFGGPRTLAFMPNSGIIFYFDIFYITDMSGRPLEAGTIPHYFNRDGMDALETVLAIIAEMD